MHEEKLVGEAHKCRNLALRYSGRPEQRFLVNIAAAFEELARSGKGTHGSKVAASGPYDNGRLLG